jgi:hypothetical protein
VKKLVIFSVVIAALTFVVFGQTKSLTPAVFEGVWKVSEIVTTGANAGTNRNPQPSVVIFTRGYYSYLSVNGTQPRPKFAPAKDPAKLTDAEKIARFEQWSPFTAQSGTYEVKGTTLTRRPTVAKNVDVMTTNPPMIQEVQMEGNDLWLIQKSAAGQPASETRTKLTRVK